MFSRKKLLVVDVAALGWDLVRERAGPIPFRKLEPVFPAVTCTAQATFRTGRLPRDHGMVANGLFFRDLRKVLFWEQAAALVAGGRIWDRFRERGGTVGLLFWQQSLGEAADLLLSPKPIHKHGGGMVQDCYGRPDDLYADLRRRIGRAFNLIHYWGPLASRKSSDWIAASILAVLDDPRRAPDLLLAYLPHLDYDLQRHGPGTPPVRRALAVILDLLSRLRDAAQSRGYDFLFFGDYAIGPVTGAPVFPNRALREAGLFQCQVVGGRQYPDFFSSRAFAMVDHEIAHVYSRDADALEKTGRLLRELPGIGAVYGAEALRELGLDHPRCGELVAVAEAGRWLAYPWWTDRPQAPDFAAHIDIHNKPGYDPCELFFGLPSVAQGWPPLSVSQDARRVRGTHGRIGPGREIAWATSCAFESEPANLAELGRAVRHWLDT